MMQAADELAACERGHDVFHAVVGVARGRRIVEREQPAGEHLDHKKEDRYAAYDLVPAGRSRDVLIEEILDGRLQAGAMFYPVDDLTHGPPAVRSRACQRRSSPCSGRAVAVLDPPELSHRSKTRKYGRDRQTCGMRRPNDKRSPDACSWG